MPRTVPSGDVAVICVGESPIEKTPPVAGRIGSATGEAAPSPAETEVRRVAPDRPRAGNTTGYHGSFRRRAPEHS